MSFNFVNTRKLGALFVILALFSFSASLSAQVILSTDFAGRTVSGLTASNVVWMENGLAADNSMTAEHVIPNSSGDLFDTADTQGHFAVDNNVGNGGSWAADITGVSVTGTDIILGSVDIGWSHFSNVGEFQQPGVNRGTTYSVTVTGSTSGEIATATVDTEIGSTGTSTAEFIPTILLSASEAYTFTITASRHPTAPAGSNSGISSLDFNASTVPPPVVLLATDFTGRTVAGLTASNIAWMESGLSADTSMTAVHVVTDSSGDLFDTPDAQGHFAVDSNVGNGGIWEADVTGVSVTGADIALESIDIGWRHFSNTGDFQPDGVNRGTTFAVTVTGSTSGVIGSTIVDTVVFTDGTASAVFIPAVVLTSSETYSVTINASAHPTAPAGSNTGISSLEFNGNATGPTTEIPPTNFLLFRGINISGATLSDFLNSDDTSGNFNPGFTINNTEAPVWLIFDATDASATGIRVESNAGTPGLAYTVEAFNWAANDYDVIDVQNESFNTDQVVQFPIVPADHVDTGGEIRTRVGWRQVGFTINFPWEVRVDQVVWVQ